MYNPLRSKNMFLRESTSPFYNTIQSAVWRNNSVSQNSHFIEITQNLINEELERNSSLDIHDMYSTGRSKQPL